MFQIKLKYIVLLLFISTMWVSAVSSTPTNDEKSTVFVDINNKNVYAGVNSTAMICPKLLPEYQSRVKYYDYINGITICNVYAKNPLTGEFDFTKIVGTVEEYNPNVKVHMNTIANEDALRDSLEAQYGVVASDTLNMKTQADIWYDEYTNTAKTFVPTSKLLISALTLDGSIIDLSKTLTLNELTLTNEYTNYPNSSAGDPTQKVFDAFKAGADARGDTDDLFSSYSYKNDFSSTEATKVLGNFIVLVISFFASFDELYRKIIFWVFLVSVAISAFFYFQNKATRKASKLHPQEDPWERIIIGTLLVFFFFIPLTTYDMGGGEKIRQSGFHSVTRFALYKGVEWADESSRILTKTYLDYIYKNTGMISSSHLFNLEKEKKLTEKQIQAQTDLLKECAKYYDKSKMQVLEGYSKDNLYPLGHTDDWNFLKDSYVDNKAAYPNIPTIYACGNVLRDNLILKEQLATINFNINKFKNYSGKTLLQDRLKVVSEGVLKQTAANGFLSVPLIGGMDAFFSATELLTTSEMRAELKNKNAKSEAKRSEGEGLIDRTIGFLASGTPYMMVPGYANVRATLIEMMKTDNKDKGVVGRIISWIIPDFVGDIWEVGIIIIATIIPILIIKSIFSYLPMLGIILGSFLTMIFFFISVQIFYLIIPFLVAYAFTAQQPQVLTSFMTRFGMVLLRPVILVISVVIALLSVSLFKGIHEYIIDPFFHLFTVLNSGVSITNSFSLNNIGDSIDSLGSGFIIGSLRALVEMFTSALVFYASFYVTYNGAEIFGSIFGVKERGMDVQENIGHNIDSSTSRTTKIV